MRREDVIFENDESGLAQKQNPLIMFYESRKYTGQFIFNYVPENTKMI